MPIHLLDPIPLAVLALGTLVAVLVALELGFRAGRWRRDHAASEHDATLGGVVGATLGLVAFMLAFTFGMAASRFEDRRLVLLEEVNAVGTAFSHAGLVQEPYRSATRRLLHEYVDVRLDDAQRGKLTSDLRRPDKLLGELWSNAEALIASSPPSAIQALFVQSIDDVINVHTKRLEFARHRIPSTIWLTLYLLVMVAMTKVGYQAGVSGSRRSPALPAMALTFSLVIALIADLDRPLQGLLKVSQQAMIELRQSMTNSP